MEPIAELKKTYQKVYPLYEQAIEKVTTSFLQDSSFQVHSVKSRIKDFDSFCMKINRKGYTNPFKDCEDIGGVRIICLFQQQIPTCVSFFKKKYSVKKIIQKEAAVDSFSYRSVHLIVVVEGVTLEVQLRTILQDAWAEMEHYVNYKKIGVEKKVLRKINALSALFEIAEDQFESIYLSFSQIKTKPLLKSTLTPELLYHYCKKTFPFAWKNPSLFAVEDLSEYSKLFELCQSKGITTLKQLDVLYKERAEDLLLYEKNHVKDILNNPLQWPALYKKVKETNHFFSPTVLLSIMVKELYK